MKNWRRYEVLLPARYNDGARIPKALLAQTILELEERFGAVSCETQVIHGRWRSGTLKFRDDLIRVFVDVEQDAEVREFFREFKERVKGRFQQEEIWLIHYAIELI
jgi:hypothetical protein